VKFRLLLTVALFSTCLHAADDVERLSPVPMVSHIPAQCRVVSVLKESPAEKAGIRPGDVLQSVNGRSPQDASGFAGMVAAAPEDSEFKILKSSGPVENLRVHLSQGRPRLGAVCDLSGWAKPGVTAAGNESLTVFSGPYALTVSGIIDKGIMFVRLRVGNDSDHPLNVAPALFKASDGSGGPMTVLSPREVMCMLYGEKGAHLLVLKKMKKDTMDSRDSSLLDNEPAAEERCDDVPVKGRLHDSSSQYAEANAQYLAAESLWPASYKPGEAADGLIYLSLPSRLPVTLQATIEGRILSAQLAMPVAGGEQMKASKLRAFFESQKKGDTIRLTLKKGKVFVGRFSMYDSVEERAWFQNPSGGMLGTVSYAIDAIRSAEPLEQNPSKPAPESGHLN